METLFLNFPTFYHCAIKGNTILSQFNAVSVLLLGKVREECVEEVIDDPAVSVYVSGRKSIRKNILTQLFSISHDEVVGRLNKLGIQDVQRMVDALSVLLEEVENLSVAAKAPLIKLSKRPGAEYDFVAEMFIAAVKCPDWLVHRLSNEAVLHLNLLGWPERDSSGQKATQQVEPEASPDAGQTDSANSSEQNSRDWALHAFPRKGKEISLSYHSLSMPEDEDMVTRYFMDFSTGNMVSLDPDDFTSFFEKKDVFKYSLVELSGSLDAIALETSRWKKEPDCTGCVMEFEISSDIGLDEINEIATNIQASVSENASTIFSVGYKFENLQKKCAIHILFQVKDGSSHTKSANSEPKRSPEPVPVEEEEDLWADLLKILREK